MCCELQPERIWTHRGVPEWWAAKAGAVYDDYVRRWQRGDVGNTSKLDGTLVIADDIGKYKYIDREASKCMLLKKEREAYVKMWPVAMGKKGTPPHQVGTSGLMTIYHRYTFDHFRDFSAHELAALRASGTLHPSVFMKTQFDAGMQALPALSGIWPLPLRRCRRRHRRHRWCRRHRHHHRRRRCQLMDAHAHVGNYAPILHHCTNGGKKADFKALIILEAGMRNKEDFLAYEEPTFNQKTGLHKGYGRGDTIFAHHGGDDDDDEDDDDADEEAQCEAWEKAKLFAQRVQVATKDDGMSVTDESSVKPPEIHLHPTEQILGEKPWCRGRAVNYADVHSASKLGTYLYNDLSSAFKKDTSTVYVDPNTGKVCRRRKAPDPGPFNKDFGIKMVDILNGSGSKKAKLENLHKETFGADAAMPTTTDALVASLKGGFK
jgi:hypothetical protein